MIEEKNYFQNGGKFNKLNSLNLKR